MAALKVTTREGTVHQLAGEAGLSVMEHIRDAGIDEMLAICGGSLACATCHVLVDASFLTLLPPISNDEDELLGSVDHRQANSRLACQIDFGPELDGLNVTIAPE